MKSWPISFFSAKDNLDTAYTDFIATFYGKSVKELFIFFQQLGFDSSLLTILEYLFNP